MQAVLLHAQMLLCRSRVLEEQYIFAQGIEQQQPISVIILLARFRFHGVIATLLVDADANMLGGSRST